MQAPRFAPDRSSTGIDSKIVGLLCYLGFFITGLLFLALEKRSTFVKFHAMQSILLSVFFCVINIVLGFLPFIGWFLGLLLAPLSFILWIALMLLALQGRWFKVPIIGDFAEQQAAKF
ncbi:DUF4870 domain-containing protein [Paenibacillus sacheonensis]|uniref:DUF4870 domain-containing protein n=1 Tax=Paenibacillus sacheonensis TaxID=742054 RepID=A0A7X5C2W5_9BACL|nr:DUF4870 domain-containing protein [Paenibacillus sacheonensis]MBM7567919.1 putative membrane protein [Paenibacillus sacheonensis]NBC70804.1 DUF4870 domain-containing protein [Paenibacillus sacheonensis]